MKLIAGVYIVMKRDNFITGTEIRSTNPELQITNKYMNLRGTHAAIISYYSQISL